VTVGAEILEAGEASVGKVVDALRNGDVVALPTETVYGLAAIIGNDEALRKIFAVKERPLIDPLIVHVLDLTSLLHLVEVSDTVFNRLRFLVDAFCPGPLTFVLKKKKHVSDRVTAGKKTVAIRMPAHPLFREVLRHTGPLAAPSANPFGYMSPTTAEHVRLSLGDKIPYILDGGTCDVGIESTILDLSGKRLTILRPGAITATMIGAVLGEEIEPYRSLIGANPSVPGILRQHYSPRTRLCLFKKSLDEVALPLQGCGDSKVAVVFLSERGNPPHLLESVGEKTVFYLSVDGDLDTVARNMFALLRRLDSMQWHMICCQVPEKEGIGLAINDRLGRAAAKFFP
jgi:L-threonylcarbamoyladenylate synthase